MAQELGPNQRKWVEALRSGVYRQGTEYLCFFDRFCCLGVAADLFLGAGFQSVTGTREWRGAKKGAPPPLLAKLAIRGRYAEDASGCNTLAELNDDGKTFDEIAAVIEADPANWFTEAK